MRAQPPKLSFIKENRSPQVPSVHPDLGHMSPQGPMKLGKSKVLTWDLLIP